MLNPLDPGASLEWQLYQVCGLEAQSTQKYLCCQDSLPLLCNVTISSASCFFCHFPKIYICHDNLHQDSNRLMFLHRLHFISRQSTTPCNKKSRSNILLCQEQDPEHRNSVPPLASTIPVMAHKWQITNLFTDGNKARAPS